MSLNEKIESHLGLVTAVVNGLPQLLPFDDMNQEGRIGLIKAAKKFDPARGFQFSTYATTAIRGEILRALGNRSRMIRIPIYQVKNLGSYERPEESSQPRKKSPPPPI